MKLHINIYGDKAYFSREIDMAKVILLLVFCSLLLLISSRATIDENEHVARLAAAQNTHSSHLKNLQAVRASQTEQLQLYAEKLAVLATQLDTLQARQALMYASVDSQLPSGPVGQTQAKESDANVVIDFTNHVDSLIAETQKQIKELSELEKIMQGHHIENNVRLQGRPVMGRGTWLSSYFGERKDPFSGQLAKHKGIDFAGPEGQAVKATGAGIVTWAGPRYGYGLLVEIDHANGLVTRYGHNKEIVVRVGQVVQQQQKIALMGNTGRSTGPHVHYEVLKNNQQVDPLPYLAAQ